MIRGEESIQTFYLSFPLLYRAIGLCSTGHISLLRAIFITLSERIDAMQSFCSNFNLSGDLVVINIII